MGMSIEEHITQLKKLKSFHNGSYGASINFALDIMHRYQQIQEIVKQKDYDRFNSRNYYGYFLRVQDIRKVIENGNKD